jgi:hypothetical protein
MRRGGMPLPGSFFFGFFAGVTTATAPPDVDVDEDVVGDVEVGMVGAAAVEQAQRSPLPEAHVFAISPGKTGLFDTLDPLGFHVTVSIGATMPTFPVRQGIGSTSA